MLIVKTFLMVVAVITLFYVPVYPQTFCESEGICVEKVSQRLLTAAEKARFSDLAGITTAVRMRFSNGGDDTIYFLSFKQFVRPFGYDYLRKVGESQWTHSPPSRGRHGKPGAEFTNPALYSYLTLGPRSAIEYEVFDGGGPNQERMYSVLVKKNIEDTPTEVTSNIFRLPFKN